MQHKSMKEPILKNEGIYTLIPQRPPIVMVDKFYGVEENQSYTGLTVTPENIFCRDGVFQETGVIEHIAQSAAARVGYIFTQRNEPVPLGFIGSVDKLNIHLLPVTGDELYTEITVVQELFDITLVSAQVKRAEQVVADCKMKIFLKKEE